MSLNNNMKNKKISFTDFKIPFNKPFIIGKELDNIKLAVANGHLAGDGIFTKKCNQWMQKKFNSPKVLLTHSCTASLEMSALLCNISPGDEVIMPSYTFVSTANAFALRGAVLVFVDIKPDTMNIDENLIEEALTSKTKAIVVVHYGGVACEMDSIMDIAARHNLIVIEDAAQGVGAKYKDNYLGTIGDLGCYSFHETKNFISGEGGAISINNSDFLERSEIIREKGTNRTKFFRGEVNKYTWVDLGSSYLPSELTAAFLYAQLEKAEQITAQRLKIWNSYYEKLEKLAILGEIQLPVIPDYATHNAHIFYIILKNEETRSRLIDYLKYKGILSVFHYIPLHSSPMGLKFTNKKFNLPVTEEYYKRILRLPLYYNLTKGEQDFITDSIWGFFKEYGK